ncbi:MAG: hypothetical protein ACRC52_07475 [Aeromonas veronii]
MTIDPRIETVARALCRADGCDPNKGAGFGVLWEVYIPDAKDHIAAYDALRKMEKADAE